MSFLMSEDAHAICPTAANGPASTVTDVVRRDIDDMLIQVPQLSKVFSILNKIGSGTFSSVYLAGLKLGAGSAEGRLFALKHIIPTSHPSRIENELKCLRDLGGHDHIIGIQACVRHRDQVVIVMPHFQHDRFQDYVQSLSLREVQLYMQSLLVALRRVHSVDVIHRDVKPSNFLFNRQTRQFALVDFGLAQRAPVGLKTITSAVLPNGQILRPKGELIQPNENQQSLVSPRKRKLEVDENCQGPALKRRLKMSPDISLDSTPNPCDKTETNSPTNASTAKSTPGNLTAVQSTEANPATFSLATAKRRLQPLDTNQATTTTPKSAAVMSRAKSPRRALLTKRAIDEHRRTTLDSFNATPARISGGQEGGKGSQGAQGVGRLSPKGGMGVSPEGGGCHCFNRPMVCRICLARSSANAPRAGTSGFRAPEVLLRYPDQTTSVDVWAAGVIFLSLLSGRYPFFKSADDLHAVAQLIAVFGADSVRDSALTYGKHLLTNSTAKPVDLRSLCERLRCTDGTVASTDAATPYKSGTVAPNDALIPYKSGTVAPSKSGTAALSGTKVPNFVAMAPNTGVSVWHQAPESAYELLRRLLDLNPATRVTAEDALKLPFFSERFMDE